MLEKKVVEKFCREVLEKSVREKCWKRVLEKRVVEKWSRKRLEKSVVKKCCREVLEKSVGEEICREVLERSIGEECCGESSVGEEWWQGRLLQRLAVAVERTLRWKRCWMRCAFDALRVWVCQFRSQKDAVDTEQIFITNLHSGSRVVQVFLWPWWFDGWISSIFFVCFLKNVTKIQY